MASAVAILLLSKISIHSVILLPPSESPKTPLQGGGRMKRLLSPSVRDGNPEGMQNMGHALISPSGLLVRPLHSWPRTCCQEGGQAVVCSCTWSYTTPKQKVSACSYAGRASHCSSTRLYWCSFYHCPYPTHSYITILVNTVTLWGLGNNLALDPIPWKLALISSGRRQTWKLQILSAAPNLF